MHIRMVTGQDPVKYVTGDIQMGGDQRGPIESLLIYEVSWEWWES